jgi:hypothetical protein
MFRYLHAGAKGERRYSSHSFSTPALDGVSGQRHALAALYPRFQLDTRLGEPQSWFGCRSWRKNFFASAGDTIPIAQSVVRHYTD